MDFKISIVRAKEKKMGSETFNCDASGPLEIVPTIKVRKLHDDAAMPCQAFESDAGYDLVAIDSGEIEIRENNSSSTGLIQYIQYRTGISIEPPPGYHVEIYPRSSISKYDFILANGVGLIDNGYRNEILVRFKYIQPRHPLKVIRNVDMKKYFKGDKIAQLVIRKTQKANFVFADSLSETDRGEGGFGSSGK